MAFTLNRQELIGNLGQDAETNFTTNNISVTKFSLATSNDYKGKDGNWVKSTTWHSIVAFNLSDYFKDLLKKGNKFYVEGRTEHKSFEPKDGGPTKYFTEVIADKVIPLDADTGSNGGNGQATTAQRQEVPSSVDDDLPF